MPTDDLELVPNEKEISRPLFETPAEYEEFRERFMKNMEEALRNLPRPARFFS